MRRTSDTQKESDEQSSDMKIFMTDLELLQITVLQMKERVLNTKNTNLTSIYTDLSRKDVSDLSEDEIVMGIL